MSAGGLEALDGLLPIRADTGMAFVVVSNHGPEHKSLVLEVVQRCTSMPVLEATDGARVVPNTVYAAPAGKTLELHRGVLHVIGVGRRGAAMPIDHFFRSLAEDQQQNPVGLILSGTGTDGTLGLAAIKGHFGLPIVQDDASAKHAGVPWSGITKGVADLVLPPGATPEQPRAYASGLRLGREWLAYEKVHRLRQIFALLRDRTGRDFSLYKAGTGHHQIERRMRLLRVHGLAEYQRVLHQDPNEVDALFGEMQFGVTRFFSDPRAFDALARELPRLLDSKPADSRVRVWVAGCATGEEVYSVAILLREYLERRRNPLQIQIFATDVDGKAIETARAGGYPLGIAGDVTPARLQRFFTREEGGYRVNPAIRDLIVFARHNLLADPPFTKLDLLCCRNLLVGLKLAARRRLGRVFAYVVKPHGLLLIGASDRPGGADGRFKDVDTEAKLFRRTSLVSLTPASVRPTITKVAVALLAGRLMTAQETERKRIAADLHDDIGQRLAAIQVDLDLLRQRVAADTGSMAAEIDSLRTHLAAVSNDLHDLARELNPAVLEHLGLQIALRDLCRNFERRERIAVVFRHREVRKTLPKDVALCLYRVAQEALRNVVKHAAASLATVTLERTPRGIGLCVKDSGKGFDPGVTGGASMGIGLPSMEERMRSVRGKLALRSRPGVGTHVHAWAPLRTRS